MLRSRYVLSLAARYLWQATPAERPRARQLAVGAGIFLLGGLNDLAVTSELYSFVYLTEYSYLALVLVMGADYSGQAEAGARIACRSNAYPFR